MHKEDNIVLYQYEVVVPSQTEEITDLLAHTIRTAGIDSGIGVAFITVTNAALCVTNNKKPEVLTDIFDDLNSMIPTRIDYRYSGDYTEASAHTKSALLGVSLDFLIHDNTLLVGKDQGVFLFNFVAGQRISLYVKLKSA